MIRFIVPLLLILITSGVVHAQKDTWVEANDGFAKCAEIGQSAGVATWQSDDFKVDKLIHLRGEMYALIHYGTKGTNTSGCADGFFRHDTLSNNWIKVAEKPHPAIGAIISNGTSIYTLADGWVLEFTTDYATYPTGWKSLTATNLKYQDIFNNSCKGTGGNGYHFQEPADAIGDTIYTFMQSDVTGCWNSNVMGKFSTVSRTWTYDRVGAFPHQMANADVQDYRICFADRIGGIFTYFLTYGRWGQDKCIPNYLYVWDPRPGPDRGWRNVSQGVNWRNMTGNSNPEQCVNKNKPAISWGPNGGWTPSWDRRDVYAASETGVYRWEGDKFYYIADYWGNASIYPTANGIFTLVLGEIVKLNPTTYVPVGKLFEVGCLHNAPRRLTTPDNGNTLYVVKEGMKDPQVCDWRESRSATLAIARLKFDADKPAKARNLHVETATYIGGTGDNKPVGTGVAGKHHVFVAGNFSNVKSAPKPFNNFNGANDNSPGRVIQMNTYGDTIISVTNLGNVIYDYEVQNFGEYRMVVSGNFGVSVLDSTGTKQLWNIPNIQGSGPIYVDIDDNGNVAVLRGKYFSTYKYDGTKLSDQRTFVVKDAQDFSIEDIAIQNNIVYIVGFSSGLKLTSGLPVASSFLKAFSLSDKTLVEKFTTFGFKGSELDHDEADTRGYRINIGKDGKIYFLGEAAGGNSVFRWNGLETMDTGIEPKSKLVTYDQYNTPFNTHDQHIAYFCTINPNTGEVERGQYIIPRQNDGGSANYRIKDGYIHADQKGYVYIGASSGPKFAGRDIQHLNGILVGDYAGSKTKVIYDMTVLVVNPDYSIRTFWGTFSKQSGAGLIKGFGIRDNIISTVGETNKGVMITGSTINGKFEGGNALNPIPFNKDFTDNNLLNDTYLAVWYQDVWRHAPEDTLQERKIPSDTVINEKALNYRANFKANVVTQCVGGDVTFTNTSVGDSLNWLWNFGEGSSLPPNTFGRGPFTLQYATPGLKTIRLDVLLKGNVKDYHQEYNYINVIAADQALSAIQGPAIVCSGTTAFYSVEPVFGIEEYMWTVPIGTIILQGQGSAKIEVSLGITPGDITVTAKTPCGFTAKQKLAITLPLGGEKSVILVVGDLTLSGNDQDIYDKLAALPGGYTVTPIADEDINEAHGSCAALIVVAPSADAQLINYKLLNAPVPVISFLSSLYEGLGMTTGSAVNDFGTELNKTIQVNPFTHELNGGLSGAVDVYAADYALNWGKPGPAGITIATIGDGKGAIIGYEQGTAMFGLNAPARRVGFYLTSVAFVELNPPGKQLLEQAICWCLYNCPSTNTITTKDVASEPYCPGSGIVIPFEAVGSFNAGTIVLASQTITMDDSKEGVTTGGWEKINSTTDAYTIHETFFRKSAFNGQFAKYNPTIIYGGTYKVSMYFPREGTFSSSTKVEITYAGGVDIKVVNQQSGSGPFDLGTYTFAKGTSGGVRVLTEGATGSVVVDYLTFESVDLDVLGGNIFTAQLSDREGNFTAPVVIGTLDATTAAPIQGIIPANTLPGTQYKVRVVSSNPSVKGSATTEFEIGGIPSDPLKINGKVLACIGSSVQTYSVDKTQGATAFRWDIPLGTHFKTPSLPNITIDTLNADPDGSSTVKIDFGTATTNNILVYAYNACGLSKERASILVEMTALPPAKPAAIVGKTIVCQQNTLNETYSISPVQYASKYHWVLSSGLTFVGSDTTNSIVVNYGTQAGGTITVSAIGECGEGEALSLIVTSVDCASAKADFTSPTEACTNTPVIFKDESIGATSWSWNFGFGANPATISGFEPAKTPPPVIYSEPGNALEDESGDDKIVTLTINAGTIYEKVIPHSIKIFAQPKLPDIIQSNSPDQAIACGLAGEIHFSIPPVDDATPNKYVWTLPSGTVVIDDTDIGIDFNTMPSGYLTVSGWNEKCGAGPPSSYYVHVNTVAEIPGNITGPTEVCSSPEGFEYQVTAMDDASVSYIWEVVTESNAIIPVSSTDNSAQVNFTDPGANIVRVKAFNNCVASAPVTIDVTVGASAAEITTPIEGKPEVCTGAQQVMYSIKPVTGATDYSWSLPSGAMVVGSSTGNMIAVNFPKALSGSINVSAILSCGASTPKQLLVNVTDGSIPPVVDGPAVLCENQQNVLFTATSDGISEYEWTLPPVVATGSSSSSSITVDFDGLVAGNINVAGIFSCGVGVPAVLPITALAPNPPLDDFEGKEKICSTETDLRFSVTALYPVTEYNWTLPSGAIIKSTNSYVNIDLTKGSSGNIAVQGKTNCGLTAIATKHVEVMANNLTGTLGGGITTICLDTPPQNYTVSGLPDALFYTWILPAATSGNSTTATITIDFSNAFVSSDIVSLANMACGDPVKVTLPLIVPVVPIAPADIAGDTYICKASKEIYSIEPVDGAISYQWNLPEGVKTEGDIDSNTITLNFGSELSGDLCVIAKGECEESEPLCLPVRLNKDPKGVCEIFIPNAFSPNGDGSNDLWQISGLGVYKNVRVQVFNRWGNLIHSASNYSTPWDGTYDGKKLPTATYYYILYLDGEAPRKGSVSILRD